MPLLPEVQPPELGPGESIARGSLAYHVQNGVPCPGHLFVTTQRLVFQPMKHGLAMKALMIVAAAPTPEGIEWSTRLDAVGSVAVDPPAQLAGQDGAYLHLHLRTGGSEEIFVAGDAIGTADAVRARIG